MTMQIATYKICAVQMGDSKESGEVEVPPEVAGLPPPGGDANSDGSATVPLTEVPPGDLDNDNPQVRTYTVLQLVALADSASAFGWLFGSISCRSVLPSVPGAMPPDVAMVVRPSYVLHLISGNTACGWVQYAQL